MQVRRLLRWLFIEPRAVWSAVGLPVLSLLVARLLPLPIEVGIRGAGYTLTFAGVAFVVSSIRQKRALFGRPSLFGRTTAWLRRFPTLFGKPRSVHLHAGSGGISISGHSASLFVGSTAPKTLDERVGALEEDIKSIREQIARTKEQLENEVRDLTNSTHSEMSTLREETTQLTGRVEELSVGSLDFELAAVAWVLFGNLYTTFPQELATLVN